LQSRCVGFGISLRSLAQPGLQPPSRGGPDAAPLARSTDRIPFGSPATNIKRLGRGGLLALPSATPEAAEGRIRLGRLMEATRRCTTQPPQCPGQARAGAGAWRLRDDGVRWPPRRPTPRQAGPLLRSRETD